MAETRLGGVVLIDRVSGRQARETMSAERVALEQWRLRLRTWTPVISFFGRVRARTRYQRRAVRSGTCPSLALPQVRPSEFPKRMFRSLTDVARDSPISPQAPQRGRSQRDAIGGERRQRTVALDQLDQRRGAERRGKRRKDTDREHGR